MTSADTAVLLLALLLDLTFGDPRWLPHPVVMTGRLIGGMEAPLRKSVRHELTAGALLLFGTVFCVAAATWLLLLVCSRIHPLAGFLAASAVSWTCLAIRSLHHESALVADALAVGDISEARRKLSFIVGRDTAELDEADIWRALVETVAENTTDGIIAPLFWLTLGGPVAGMAYKAVSTLDSMVGYRNERYLYFGRASARMDDLLNFIPARLTALLMVIAAPLAGLSPVGAAKTALRDRLKHPSPNSGHSEAAAAGALGVRLGGMNFYGGVASRKEYIGDSLSPLDERAYRGMIRLMYLTALIMAAACVTLTYLFRGLYVPHL